MDRRDFIKTSSIGAGLMILPSFVAGQSKTEKAPNSRLNIALVGAAGRARSHTISLAGENIVAFCDVDMNTVNTQRAWQNRNGPEYNKVVTAAENKGAKWYKDYRVMLDEMDSEIDAVVVTTPDHMHYPVAMSAINRGKHVYVEKPLTHTVEEARILTTAASKAGVISQMGNQGNSNEGTRIIREWVQAGVIGDIREVHSWTNRPAIFWPQGMGKPDHSEFIPVVPEGMDWDLWLGVAESRPYDPSYAPFAWRGFLDFGAGAMGDMACHIMNSAYWALDLAYPTHIEAASTELTGYSFPAASVVTYQFPERGKMPPVTYKWYDGFMRPPVPNFLKDSSVYEAGLADNGTLLIGEDAAIITDTYSASAKILPTDKFRELRSELPPKTIPRIRGTHMEEWTNAIRENRPASSDFGYAGPFTESVLLGNVAVVTGRKMEYNAEKAEFVNDPEANKLIRKDYPAGWILT